MTPPRFRLVGLVIAARRPIRLTAAFNDSPDSCSRGSSKRRTAHCLNSSGYCLAGRMTPTLSWNQALRQPRDDSLGWDETIR